MTPDQLSAIRKRADAATPGPWVSDVLTGHIQCEPKPNGEAHIVFSGRVPEEDIRDWGEDGWFYTFDTPETKEFVEHAREDVPALLDEVERLNEVVSQLQADKRELVGLLKLARTYAIRTSLKEQIDAAIAKHGEQQ